LQDFAEAFFMEIKDMIAKKRVDISFFVSPIEYFIFLPLIF
jgi:hypothetical protein